MLNKILLDLTEILCLYLILRGINRFKVKDSLIFIFATKQYIRWVTIAMLFTYVAGVNVIWYFHRDLGHYLGIIGSLVIPSFMIQIGYISLKKVLFALLMFLLASTIPILITYVMNFPNAFAFIMIFATFSLLLHFEMIYKIHQFLSKRPLLLNGWCAMAFLWLLSTFTNWYNYMVVIVLFLFGFLLAGITIYGVQKYHEKHFVSTLVGRSYSELKEELKKKSSRYLDMERLDFYEFNTIWFTNRFANSLDKEFNRLNLTADFVKEDHLLKIHLFKIE